MIAPRIYLDNQATTRCHPAVVAAMLPMFEQNFANPGSISHEAGREAAEAVHRSIEQIAQKLAGSSDEIVITSGATEANNLALFGTMLHPRQKRCKVISLETEHKAILDPLKRLAEIGFEIVLLPVLGQDNPQCGQVDLNRLAETIDDQTALVSIMYANNEIGVIQPIQEIGRICRQHGAWFHTDATQAVGNLRIDVNEQNIDLMSFSAHKFYGPKGVGGLFVRRRDRSVRLAPQIVGGGQQNNFRSGTLNPPGIVGMAKALELAYADLDSHQRQAKSLRDELWNQIQQATGSLVKLNGPALTSELRLNGNLNCCWQGIEGEALMMGCPQVCISSGSACTAADPTTSHVLRGIGLSEEAARCSTRFGLGRFNTGEEIQSAAQQLSDFYLESRKQFGLEIT